MTTTSTGRPTVVFGDDGSSSADIGWLWINSQRWDDWDLVVMTAEPPPLGTVVDEARSTPHPSDQPPTRRAFAEAGFAETRCMVAEADPRVVLGGCGDAGLLVVGSAHSGSGRWHVGSTAEWLLHNPPAPLLLAHGGSTVRHALVCADGSAHAVAAAEALFAMPWSNDVAVTVVAVEDGRVDTATAMDEMRSVLASAVSEVTETVLSGRNPHRHILAVAESSDVDLIVLGTRGHTVLQRLTLGSTASAVARHAPCAVLAAAG